MKNSLYLLLDQKLTIVKETFSIPEFGIIIATNVDLSTRNTMYRGMDLHSREIVFERGPFVGHTNSCAGFLAIVHALSYLRQAKSTAPVYCSNGQAIKWVKGGGVTSHVTPTKIRDDYIRRIDLAGRWLWLHKYENELLVWDPAEFGENPATYTPKKRGELGGKKRAAEDRLAALREESLKRHS